MASRGRTLRKFGISRNCPRLRVYCEAHPEYARDVLPLAAANQKAADLQVLLSSTRGTGQYKILVRSAGDAAMNLKRGLLRLWVVLALT
jgi:hypothetical protein